MLIGVKGRLGRHRRTFTFVTHCAVCAVDDALRLAKYYGDYGQGTYGPMGLFGFQWGAMVLRSDQSGLPA